MYNNNISDDYNNGWNTIAREIGSDAAKFNIITITRSINSQFFNCQIYV